MYRVVDLGDVVADDSVVEDPNLNSEPTINKSYCYSGLLNICLDFEVTEDSFVESMSESDKQYPNNKPDKEPSGNGHTNLHTNEPDNSPSKRNDKELSKGCCNDPTKYPGNSRIINTNIIPNNAYTTDEEKHQALGRGW